MAIKSVYDHLDGIAKLVSDRLRGCTLSAEEAWTLTLMIVRELNLVTHVNTQKLKERR